MLWLIVPDVAASTIVYVPAGVPCFKDDLLPPQPANPNALNRRNAMESLHFLFSESVKNKPSRHKTAVCAGALGGKKSEPFAMAVEPERAVVLMVTLNGSVLDPLTLSGLGETEQ